MDPSYLPSATGPGQLGLSSHASAGVCCWSHVQSLTEVVAGSLNSLTPLAALSKERVLVLGHESNAALLATLPGFPVLRKDASQPELPGVFHIDTPEDLPTETETTHYDMVFAFAAHACAAGGLVAKMNAAIRAGGAMVGVGVFEAQGSNTVARFLLEVEQCGLRLELCQNLRLHGAIVGAEDSVLPMLFIATKPSSPQQPAAPVHQMPSMHSVESKQTNASASTATTTVVTGVSLGLPNALRPDCSVFDASNWDRVFSGETCISQLTDDDKERILGMNIVQKLRIDGKRVSVPLTKPEQVIQLASRLGHFDLRKEYGVPPFVIEVLDSTYQLAMAAGIEALENAGLSIYAPCTEGAAQQPADRTIVGLPEEMRDETGIIFASSFPCMESTVREAGRCAQHHLLRALEEYKAARQQTADSETNADAEVSPAVQAAENYQYDRKLLFKLLVMANNQLAELIHARGPNVHVNSACSSMTQAIAIAQDWLRLGRCKRVVVISADNTTSDDLLQYVGTGFLALTAASTNPRVETAALPFDKRRNGMILGMGAAGVVLETAEAARRRGARPEVELVASHFLNSAFHASLLHREHIAEQLDHFMDKVERDHGIARSDVATDGLYFSHETFTCAKGGCAKAEMDALARAFGPNKAQMQVVNTKGFTGHPMGVGIEDVVAIASLQRGLAPPTANWQVPDPCLGELNLSRGGTHTRHYALRFAAGFGSQFTFLLFRRLDTPKQPCRPALQCAEVARSQPDIPVKNVAVNVRGSSGVSDSLEKLGLHAVRVKHLHLHLHQHKHSRAVETSPDCGKAVKTSSTDTCQQTAPRTTPRSARRRSKSPFNFMEESEPDSWSVWPPTNDEYEALTSKHGHRMRHQAEAELRDMCSMM